MFLGALLLLAVLLPASLAVALARWRSVGQHAAVFVGHVLAAVVVGAWMPLFWQVAVVSLAPGALIALVRGARATRSGGP